MWYLTVSEGKLEVHETKGMASRIAAKFEPNDVEGLGKFFRDHDIFEVFFSSSVDFPEENGMPDVDVHDWMQKAWAMF